MGRAGFVVQRLLLLIPVAVGVTIVVSFMVHLIPGDPAATILGIHATPKAVALLHQQWGLNRPLASQYWLFLDRLLHGNLGQSIFYGGSVSSLILSHLPPTLWLLADATVLTVAISVPLAVLAATRRDGIRDHAVRAVPLVGLGMPSFWLGFLLIYAFAISLHLFPVSGDVSGLTRHLHSMFLPSLTVAMAHTTVVIRSLRASMLYVLTAEYIVKARSKGVPPQRLFLRHVLRNAVIPAVTVLAINIGFLVGTTVIIEQIFAVPGLGQLLINSIFQRDFPVVQGVTLVFGVMVVLVNLLADMAYAALDPRVRFDR